MKLHNISAALLLLIPLSVLAEAPVYRSPTITQTFEEAQKGASQAREKAAGVTEQVRVLEPAVMGEPGHIWLEMGFGGGFGEREMELASGGYSLRYVQGVHAVSLQRIRHVDLGRTGSNLSSCIFSLDCEDIDLTTVSETALLYGRATTTSNGYRIYSAGPVRTVMSNFEQLGDSRDTYGLRLEMATHRVFGGVFALTGTLYANLNKENSFAGAVASIGIGSFN